MTRTIIIGDVHGCIDELVELWERVAPRRGDHVVFVGDLVDRGPDSVAVIRFVREKIAGGFRVDVVMGNHERKHWRFQQYHARMVAQEKDPPFHSSHEINTVNAALTDAEKTWLAELPHYIRIPEYDAVVVHGAIPEDVTFLPPAEEIRGYSNRKREKYDLMMYLRFLSPSGEPVSGLVAGPEDTFWAEMYDGRLGHVFFGHQPIRRPEPVFWEYATAIDLACCFGGWLCAVVLEGEDRSFITVQARATYSNTYREDIRI